MKKREKIYSLLYSLAFSLFCGLYLHSFVIGTIAFLAYHGWWIAITNEINRFKN